MDFRDGESSRASQANSGLVMAIIMAGLLPVRGKLRGHFYYATYPRMVQGLVEKSEKITLRVLDRDDSP
jgi:hypothetical protein